ncbi:MAG: hypothetical protein JWM99_1327 [Verrucomicrobiales bacterium]|jgi:hypothetical protein|nr:hypothetical protein [Verrucomicrobiales bacterium]
MPQIVEQIEEFAFGRKPATRLFVGALFATWILYCFNPTEYRFFPQCPLYTLTGWQCPGCGTLRAIHALSHGQLQAALRFNPLLIIVSPFIALGFARELWLEARGERTNWNAIPAAAIWAILIVLITYGILRNLIPA